MLFPKIYVDQWFVRMSDVEHIKNNIKIYNKFLVFMFHHRHLQNVVHDSVGTSITQIHVKKNITQYTLTLAKTLR